MKVAVIGAGAIGGFVAARLAKASNQVSVLLRGKNLEAVRATGGLKLIEQDNTEFLASVFATDKISEIEKQDLIILAVKSHQVIDVASQLPQLYTSTTRIVTMQNGIPWWFFQGLEGYETAQIRSLDPDGLLSQFIDSWRIIGSIVYPAAEVISPGVVKVIEGNRFSLGEPLGRSETLSKIVELFTEAGFKAPISRDIRSEIMLKIFGNMSFNPISALTHATLEDICLDPNSRALVTAIMQEGLAICNILNIQIPVSIEKRIAGAQAIGQHKTSMLQDIESGRRIELDALVSAMIELGEATGVATPYLRTIHSLTHLLAKTLEKYQGRLVIEQN